MVIISQYSVWGEIQINREKESIAVYTKNVTQKT